MVKQTLKWTSQLGNTYWGPDAGQYWGPDFKLLGIEEEWKRRLAEVGATLWKRGVWAELCPLQKFYAEDLTPNVTVFGDRALKEAIKGKWGHKCGP